MMVAMSWPAYLDTWKSGELSRRIDEGMKALESCTVCPRDCRVNRLVDEKKVCKVGRRAVVSSHFAHFGEEDCLRGWNGSGTGRSRTRGPRLPIVYNTSAYDPLHSLAMLDGVVDIYMPDFKYWDEGASARILKAKRGAGAPRPPGPATW